MDIINEIMGSGIGYMEALKYLSAIGKKCSVNKSWTWDVKKERDFNEFMKRYERLKTTRYPFMQYICAGYKNKDNRFFCIDNGDKDVDKILPYINKKQPIVICRLQEKRKHLEVVILY